MTTRQSLTRRGTARGAGRAGRQDAGRPAPRWPAVILRVTGSGLLIATAAIHLDLYLTGYRTIPTIGWLFLLQVIAAFGLGLAVLAIPRRHLTLSRLAAAAGAGFALATLGGYLLSAWTGLFGFKEVRTGAGIAAGLVEVAAFVVLAALTLAPAPATAAADRAATAPARFPAQIPPAATRAAGTAAAGLTVAALVLFGLVVAGASPPPPAATGTGTGPPPENHDDRRDHGPDQRQRPHALLVRPRHPGHLHVLRQLRRVLAPGNRHHHGRAGPARQGHHHHPHRRLTPAHLQRAPPVHLHRRHRPRPGPRQQPQPQRRALARSARLPVRRNSLRGMAGARTGIGSPAAWLGRMALGTATSPAVPRGELSGPAVWRAELMTIKEYRCGRSCLLFPGGHWLAGQRHRARPRL